jgi:signal transduction histidine kinase
MSPAAYAIIGLTAIVACLVGVLMFATLRFAAAARDSRRYLGESKSEAAFMTAALQEALTKLKAQERETSLRAEASERLSGEIVESLTSGLLVVGMDGLIRILNPAGRRMLSLDDAVEKNYREMLRDVTPLARVIEECLNTGRSSVRLKLDVESARQGPTHLGVSVSPLSDGRARLHGAICLFTDLSPVIEMEEQLRLKDSLAQVGELTAGIAHEFRNGLATIHGYARLLDLNALPGSFRPYVEGIRQETEALGQVVTNFLNFARPAQVSLSPVNLRAVVERAIDEVRSDARARGGNVDINGDFGVVDGDDVLLRQAFSNLLRNALEACAEAAIPPVISLGGRLDGDHVRISVTDNGPGIAPAIRERLFRPFFSTRGRGTGLGLALVQNIVVIHNGRVQLLSASDAGTSMQVTLPLSRPGSESPGPA